MTDSASDPAALVELCVAAGVPAMAATLIRDGATLDEARARIDYSGRVRELVAIASGHPAISATFADEAIAEKLTIEQVRDKVFEAMADADAAAPVSGHIPSNKTNVPSVKR